MLLRDALKGVAYQSNLRDALKGVPYQSKKSPFEQIAVHESYLLSKV